MVEMVEPLYIQQFVLRIMGSPMVYQLLTVDRLRMVYTLSYLLQTDRERSGSTPYTDKLHSCPQLKYSSINLDSSSEISSMQVDCSKLSEVFDEMSRSKSTGIEPLPSAVSEQWSVFTPGLKLAPLPREG
jgi:hypothetical protein